MCLLGGGGGGMNHLRRIARIRRLKTLNVFFSRISRMQASALDIGTLILLRHINDSHTSSAGVHRHISTFISNTLGLHAC